MKKLFLLTLLLVAYSCTNHLTHKNLSLTGEEKRNPLLRLSAKNAKVYFKNLKEGQIVKSPLKIEFGVKNMTISPAGTDKPYSGHHHLLIDIKQHPVASLPLPANKNIIHFGKGQIETTIKLSKGIHTLQLLLANYAHVPHRPIVISKKLTVLVK